MKVIRSFHDYYDGVLGQFAMEQVPLFIRKSEYIDNEVTKAFIRSMSFPRFRLSATMKPGSGYWWARRVEMDYAIFGFCGKVFPVFLQWGCDKRPEYAFVHSEDLLLAYEDVDPSVGWLEKRNSFELVHELAKKPEWSQMFVSLKTPTFVYSQKHGFLINPVMKEYGVEKLLHPYTVVQELEMFFNNVLCENNTPRMPVGNDIVIAESKGFDKYSFRKLPTKRKKD